jgi:hypothetical protein
MQEAGARIVNSLKQEEDAICKIMLKKSYQRILALIPVEVGLASLQATNQAGTAGCYKWRPFSSNKTKTEQALVRTMSHVVWKRRTRRRMDGVR